MLCLGPKQRISFIECSEIADGLGVTIGAYQLIFEMQAISFLSIHMHIIL
jgi:hypothetical protein